MSFSLLDYLTLVVSLGIALPLWEASVLWTSSYTVGRVTILVVSMVIYHHPIPVFGQTF